MFDQMRSLRGARNGGFQDYWSGSGEGADSENQRWPGMLANLEKSGPRKAKTSVGQVQQVVLVDIPQNKARVIKDMNFRVQLLGRDEDVLHVFREGLWMLMVVVAKEKRHDVVRCHGAHIRTRISPAAEVNLCASLSNVLRQRPVLVERPLQPDVRWGLSGEEEDFWLRLPSQAW